MLKCRQVQLIGQVLQETYRIESLLGRGGKGEVYLASHMRLPRQFAVKVLFPHNAYKREEVLRFRREAEVVSALGHPHIIEVIDFNHTSWGAPYIVKGTLSACPPRRQRRTRASGVIAAFPSMVAEEKPAALSGRARGKSSPREIPKSTAKWSRTEIL